jgi:hypothetical protein
MYKYIKSDHEKKNPKIENINNIPHEYYRCDIARTNEKLCNGNNFSKLVPLKAKP